MTKAIVQADTGKQYVEHAGDEASREVTEARTKAEAAAKNVSVPSAAQPEDDESDDEAEREVTCCTGKQCFKKLAWPIDKPTVTHNTPS